MTGELDRKTFAELHAAYAAAQDRRSEALIIQRVAQMIWELEIDLDPEYGEDDDGGRGLDALAAARDFLNGEDPNRY